MYQASAPGTLMLLGEYAVLYGKSALVTAIDQRIHVKLQVRNDEKVIITSTLGKFAGNLKTLSSQEPFQFVLTAIMQFLDKIPCGFELKIEAQFSSQLGLGSSAAVTVATIKVLDEWLSLNLDSLAIVKHGIKIVRMVQGQGSGADIAASTYGGIVYYCNGNGNSEPIIKKHALTYPLTVIYSGFKTKTAIAIKKVMEHFKDHPQIFNSILQSIDHCVIAAHSAILNEDWTKVGHMMSEQQELLTQLGVNLPILQKIVDFLKMKEEVLGAKISGSGLGDCIIGLGQGKNLREMENLEWHHDKIMEVPVTITLKGAISE